MNTAVRLKLCLFVLLINLATVSPTRGGVLVIANMAEGQVVLEKSLYELLLCATSAFSVSPWLNIAKKN